MEFDIIHLKHRLNEYFCGNLSKEQLGGWAQRAYYDLLKGEYLEINKIMVYPFVKVISKIHVIEDPNKDIWPCSEEEISGLGAILRGEKNKCYSVEMTIPWKICTDRIGLDNKKRIAYKNLLDILNCYLEKKQFTREDCDVCLDILSMDQDGAGTVQSILDMYIRSFLENNMVYDGVELYLYSGMGLYTLRKKDNRDIACKVIRYLECYIGERPFCVDMMFIRGEVQLVIST